MRSLFLCGVALGLIPARPTAAFAPADRPDVVFADFEAETYAPWVATGDAFGEGPAAGALPGQMSVGGFEGRRLVNSFVGGDGTTGTLTSPEFRVDRAYIRFLIGGGGYPEQTCVNLTVGGKVVRTATGPNTAPGGSENLQVGSWDVADLEGQTARIEVVDRATGGWGHVNLDHIVFTDRKPPGLLRDVVREIVVEAKCLHVPVKTGAVKRVLTVNVEGEEPYRFDIELADGEPDWWAPLEVGRWAGKTVAVKVDRLPEDSKALESLRQSDGLIGSEPLYREALRPQLHVSPRRGWNNDPNGLVFFDGTYHLFFQHNPYGWNWGNMHWGHAVSRDLVRWQERGDVLYPDAMGPMFSGSGVVDRANSSGLGKDGVPPILLFYTAAGDPTVQCLAYSTDGGRTFAKYAGNPIVPQIQPGNRDPKVFWHEPTGRWVMALYVGIPEAKGTRHVIQILTSSDAKSWEFASEVEGFYECPDLFPLALDGDPTRTKWVLTAASSEYQVGSFDGRTFRPETPKRPGHRGRGFYAAQTYSDIPAADGRRLMFGWLQAPSPGMPFNQCLSVPLELTLKGTPDGPRLAFAPARELRALRAESTHRDGLVVEPGRAVALDAVRGELLELRAELQPEPAAVVTFQVRGVPIVYHAATQELEAGGRRAPAPLKDGVIDLAVLTDRTVFEVFAADGLAYLPFPVIPKPGDQGVTIRVEGGSVRFRPLRVHRLGSIWEDSPVE